MTLSITLTYARSLFGEVALRSNDREGRLFFFTSGVIHLQIHPFALGIRVLCQLLAETLILEQGDHIGRIAGAGLGVWGAVNLMEGYGGDNPSANAHVR